MGLHVKNPRPCEEIGLALKRLFSDPTSKYFDPTTRQKPEAEKSATSRSVMRCAG